MTTTGRVLLEVTNRTYGEVMDLTLDHLVMLDLGAATQFAKIRYLTR